MVDQAKIYTTKDHNKFKYMAHNSKYKSYKQCKQLVPCFSSGPLVDR